MSKAEYRTDIDFFRTLKQKCKKNNICWFFYKNGIEKLKKEDEDEAKKLNGYLSENFPLTQQLAIVLQYLWGMIIVITPVVLFILCFFI